MDRDQISKIEEIIENHLFREENTPDYELKKMDVMVKYLIYQQLKEINMNLDSIEFNLARFIEEDSGYIADQLEFINKKLESIDESLVNMANPGIWEK